MGLIPLLFYSPLQLDRWSMRAGTWERSSEQQVYAGQCETLHRFHPSFASGDEWEWLPLTLHRTIPPDLICSYFTVISWDCCYSTVLKTIDMFCFRPVPFSLLWILLFFFFFACSLRQTATTTVRWRVMSTRTSASAPALVLSKSARQIFFLFFGNSTDLCEKPTDIARKEWMHGELIHLTPFPKLSRGKYYVIQDKLGRQSFHYSVKKWTNILSNISLKLEH